MSLSRGEPRNERAHSQRTPDKLLMPVMLHAAVNLALQDVEHGKQGGPAVPLVVTGHRPALPRLNGSAGCVR